MATTLSDCLSSNCLEAYHRPGGGRNEDGEEQPVGAWYSRAMVPVVIIISTTCNCNSTGRLGICNAADG